MTKEKLFQSTKQLIEKLQEYKVTGTITFKDTDEKLLLKEVYTSIYKGIQVDLSCGKCVLNYLNLLLAWYEREYPLYLKTLNVAEASTPAPQSDEIVETTQTSTKAKSRRKKK